MFRELSRIKQKLSINECIDILKTQTRGVLSVIGGNGYPYGMPMNHLYNENDDSIYFHSGKKGHRLDALKSCDKVSFCVCDKGYQENGEWALNVKSVIVFGRIEVLNDYEKITEVATKLSLKFTNDENYIKEEIEKSIDNTLLLKLIPDHICGKLVKEA